MKHIRRWLSLALLVIGITVAIVGYGINTHGWFSDGDKKAHETVSQIQETWKEHPTPKDPTNYKINQTMGIMRVPKWPGWRYPLIQGIAKKQLGKGISHYPTTALPGQIGNFAVAAHWSGPFAPFNHLQNLKDHDKVIVETQHYIYTYEITKRSQQTVVTTFNGGWVLDPVPGDIHKKPTEHLMTLTTCDHLWHSSDRQVAFAKLVSTIQKNE